MYTYPVRAAACPAALATIKAEIEAVVVRARARGLRLADDYQRANLDPSHLWQARCGVLFVCIANYGEIPLEEEVAIVKRLAVKFEEREREDRHRAEVTAIVEAHYQRWLVDPSIPYQVPWKE